jgi:hypothetical protein
MFLTIPYMNDFSEKSRAINQWGGECFKFPLNSKQSGEALELLTSLETNTASLVFFDPQYEPVRKMLPADYPLYSQSDYQILRILEQVERILKPSAFCLLWVNKTLLGNDRVPL